MPNGNNGFSFVGHLARHIGQTVTIFTTSGGQSGRGFTGLLASVNNRFVRLIVQIGSAPGCALGNCCEEREEMEIRRAPLRNNEFAEVESQDLELQNQALIRERENQRDRGRFNCNGRTLGAIVDIPIDRIAAFVHNAVGSGGI